MRASLTLKLKYKPNFRSRCIKERINDEKSHGMIPKANAETRENTRLRQLAVIRQILTRAAFTAPVLFIVLRPFMVKNIKPLDPQI